MLKRFRDMPGASQDAPKSNIIIAHAGREPAVLPVSCSLPQLPESPRSPFAAQLKPTSSLESSSSSRQSDSRFEGHLLAGRGSVEPRSVSSAEAFDEVPLQCTQNGALNEKLVQLLERRKAKEVQTSKKLEAEHAVAMQRKENTHMEQLELMDAAHHRTVAHLELEMDKLRSQLTTALTRWEAAEEQGQQLKSKLEAERKLRLKAEREQLELSSLLEAELQFD